jgi:hypothetical protein
MHFYSQRRFSAFCDEDEDDELSRGENNSTTTASLKFLSLSLCVRVCVYIPSSVCCFGEFPFYPHFSIGKKEYKESSSSFWFEML